MKDEESDNEDGKLPRLSPPWVRCSGSRRCGHEKQTLNLKEGTTMLIDAPVMVQRTLWRRLRLMKFSENFR